MQIVAFQRALRECADTVMQVRRAADLDEVERGERIGLMLSMEGVEALGYEPALFDLFAELGIRMASLTWNRRNPFADGSAERGGAGGLSALGERLVDRMVELGTMLDLAHASERTFYDVLERAGDGAVLVSHAACRAVNETPRNLSDDQLRALAERGGMLGIMLLPFVVDPRSLEIDRVLDHIDHAVDVMGIGHVGLGGDFIVQVQRALGLRRAPDTLRPEGLPDDATIDGLAGPEDYQTLVDAMRRRGYSDGNVDAIAGGNFLRFFRRSLPA
jgi:membrane dipeptidase